MATEEELASALQDSTEALANALLQFGPQMSPGDQEGRKRTIEAGRALYQEYLTEQAPITQIYTVELTRNIITNETATLTVDAADEYEAAKLCYKRATDQGLWVEQPGTSSGGVDVEVNGVSWREDLNLSNWGSA